MVCHGSMVDTEFPSEVHSMNGQIGTALRRLGVETGSVGAGQVALGR